MSKDTFYFSHDYTARLDEKIKRLLRQHGMQGYGVFWSIVEDLYCNHNQLICDIEGIAYDLRVDVQLVHDVVHKYELFIIDGANFYSDSIARRLDKRNEKSAKASIGASSRWGENDARKKANDHIFYVLKIFNESEKFIKVGITSESVSRRYAGKLAGYDYELLYQCDLGLNEIIKLEQSVQSSFKKYNPNIKFPGYLECIDIECIADVISFSQDFAMRHDTFRNAIKESKVKESILNDIIVKDSKSISRFAPPSQEMVQEYAIQISKGSINAPEDFVNYYASNGWKVGKNPMKDWKAGYRNWTKNENQYEAVKGTNQHRAETKTEQNERLYRDFGKELTGGKPLPDIFELCRDSEIKR